MLNKKIFRISLLAIFVFTVFLWIVLGTMPGIYSNTVIAILWTFLGVSILLLVGNLLWYHDKKRWLQVSFAGSIVFLALAYVPDFFRGNPCDYTEYDSGQPSFDCAGFFIEHVLFIFLPVLFFSIITYRIKEPVFLAWKKFTFSYLVIYLLINSTVPLLDYIFAGQIRLFVAIIFTSIYVILSLAIIAVKFYKLRDKKSEAK